MPLEVLATPGSPSLAVVADVDDMGPNPVITVGFNFSVWQYWWRATLLTSRLIARPRDIVLASACSVPHQRVGLIAGVLDNVVFSEDWLLRADLAIANGRGLWAPHLYTLGCRTAPFAIRLAVDSVFWIPVLVVVCHQVVALLAGELHHTGEVKHGWGDIAISTGTTRAGVTATYGLAHQIPWIIHPFIAAAGGVEYVGP